jgi:hypothetical protein
MLCPNSTNQLKSLAMSASQSFNLQGHRRFAGTNFAPFGSVEKTTLAGKHFAVFWKIADFSARICDPPRRASTPLRIPGLACEHRAAFAMGKHCQQVQVRGGTGENSIGDGWEPCAKPHSRSLAAIASPLPIGWRAA